MEGPEQESWSYKITRTVEMPRCFGRVLHRKGMCDNLSNALKLLANQQKDGDSPVKMVVQGLLKIMDGPRKFIAVDNHAEKIGDLEK